MATVLLIRELGAGLGHLVNLLPLVRGLTERRHQVVIVVRDLSRVGEILGGIKTSCLQAPAKTNSHGRRIITPRSFADILFNCGFGDAGELATMAGAWRTIYNSVRPDLIIFDHSPTALLAARGFPAKRALIDTGFSCPLDTSPLPDLRRWLGDAAPQIQEDEARILENMNRAMESWGQARLERVTQLYCEVDEHFLLTFEELDHYTGRRGATYWGASPNAGGKRPAWPDGQGKRIFACLKPFPALASLLGVLKRQKWPTLVVTDGIDEGLQREMASTTLHFQNIPADLAEVGAWCDLAILNGTHGTTASMLLAGKRTLQLPLDLEQTLLSEAVVRMGAGLHASPARAAEIASALRMLLDTDHGIAAARRFAARYASFDFQGQSERMLHRAEELLNST